MLIQLKDVEDLYIDMTPLQDTSSEVYSKYLLQLNSIEMLSSIDMSNKHNILLLSYKEKLLIKMLQDEMNKIMIKSQDDELKSKNM